MFSKHMQSGASEGHYIVDTPDLTLSVCTYLPVGKQCALVNVNRGVAIHIPLPKTEEDLVTLIRILELKDDPE